MEQLTQYTNILSFNEWFLLAIAAILVMSLFSFSRQRTQQRNQQLSMLSLQRDLRALANAAVGVGGRVLEIERHQRKRPALAVKEKKPKAIYNTVATPPAPIEQNYNPSNQPYEQAIRMAYTGASTHDIVKVCGISESEADLVNMMHRLDKVS